MRSELKAFSKSFTFLIPFCLLLAACSGLKGLPSIDETGNESATLIPGDEIDAGLPEEGSPSEDQGVSPNPLQKLVLNQAMNIRFNSGGVLEWRAELPVGTQIEIPESYELINLDYRNSSGGLDRSSTGFITPVKILSVPSNFESHFSKEQLAEINSTGGGLYIGGSIVGALQGALGNFSALSSGSPGNGFLQYFYSSGKPKFSHLSSVKKRFGDRLNQGVDLNSLSVSDQTKWQKIYNELKLAADRSVETKKAYLMIDQTSADSWSKEFERSGAISPWGAWTIAVNSTAVRHGFPNVPCAEFQSEMLRQAYQRAGYRLTEDFNSSKGNPVIWSNTAAVVNFSKALYTAGWVPWDTLVYRPITGAFIMHGAGYTPGHTYIAAGDDGRYIVDNGTPQGRDLRKSSTSTISMMYQGGVFFLPPGITPPAW